MASSFRGLIFACLTFVFVLPAQAEDIRLLVMNVSAKNEADSETAKAATLLLTQIFADKAKALTVYSQNELASLLNIEAQRSLVCDDSSSCVSEVADALGARFVVIGNFGRVGSDGRFMQVTLYDSEKVEPLDRIFVNGTKDTQVLNRVSAKVVEVANKLQRYARRIIGKKQAPKVSVEEVQKRETLREDEQKKITTLETGAALYMVGGIGTALVCGTTALSVLGMGGIFAATEPGVPAYSVVGVGALGTLATGGISWWLCGKSRDRTAEVKRLRSPKPNVALVGQARPQLF